MIAVSNVRTYTLADLDICLRDWKARIITGKKGEYLKKQISYFYFVYLVELRRHLISLFTVEL